MTFSQSVTVAGDTTSLSRTSGTGPYHRTARLISSETNARTITATSEPIAAGTDFTLTYTAPVSTGFQFIGLGDITVCL